MKLNKFTPEIDNLIREVYRTSTGNGEVKRLSERLNMPRWVIRRRAILLGVIEARIKEKPWSEQELHMLEKNALYTPEIIQRKLKKAGFIRSIVAIQVKRTRMEYAKQQIKCSARAWAECFGVDVKVLTRWIDKGLLKAQRRGTKRTEAQGGDEWYIKPKDIRSFIIENIGIIDIRKVDKFWLVDILTKKGGYSVS